MQCGLTVNTSDANDNLNAYVVNTQMLFIVYNDVSVGCFVFFLAPASEWSILAMLPSTKIQVPVISAVWRTYVRRPFHKLEMTELSDVFVIQYKYLLIGTNICRSSSGEGFCLHIKF